MKAAYLLAFRQVLGLVNSAFRAKITAKFDRMNYGCPEVGKLHPKHQEIVPINLVREGYPVATCLSNYGSSGIVTERFD
jgi:hypothetical protein